MRACARQPLLKNMCKWCWQIAGVHLFRSLALAVLACRDNVATCFASFTCHPRHGVFWLAAPSDPAALDD